MKHGSQKPHVGSDVGAQDHQVSKQSQVLLGHKMSGQRDRPPGRSHRKRHNTGGKSQGSRGLSSELAPSHSRNVSGELPCSSSSTGCTAVPSVVTTPSPGTGLQHLPLPTISAPVFTHGLHHPPWGLQNWRSPGAGIYSREPVCSLGGQQCPGSSWFQALGTGQDQAPMRPPGPPGETTAFCLRLHKTPLGGPSDIPFPSNTAFEAINAAATTNYERLAHPAGAPMTGRGLLLACKGETSRVGG